AGNVVLPLLGTLHAEGKTPDQFAKEIAAQLAAKYVRQPDVEVVIKQTNAQTITVEGAVQNPGVFPVVPGTTLIKAVALAHGTSPEANPRRVVVFRTISGVRNAAAFDLQSIRRAQAPDPEIFGNDIVVVDGSGAKAKFQSILQTLPLIALFRPF
nr:polysaccharide biosynthesis/export family protein [Pseudomonadota bacterium]